jgi:hypothetical protein
MIDPQSIAASAHKIHFRFFDDPIIEDPAAILVQRDSGALVGLGVCDADRAHIPRVGLTDCRVIDQQWRTAVSDPFLLLFLLRLV